MGVKAPFAVWRDVHFCAEHYNYFRDYDPAAGRYLESDPVGLKGGLDTFGYVMASPLAYVDPDGQARTTVDAAIENAARRGDVGELRVLMDAVSTNEQRAAVENAINRLTSKAQDIIAKECKGSVNREFPSELRNTTLEEIIKLKKTGSDAANKAWKLLNDKRFKK